MKTITKTILSISTLFLLHGYVSAQFTGTMSGVEKTKVKSLWFYGTNNAAGLTVDQQTFSNQTALGYDHSSGDFHRPQVGETESALVFNSEGGVKLNGSYLWGNFVYANKTNVGTQWNASLIDPLRDLPFFIADKYVSDWKINTYDMQMKISTPFFLQDKVAAGLDVHYRVEIAGKQVDPRADNRFRAIHVKPGLVYRLHPSIFVGLNGEYYNHREDSPPYRSNNQLNHNVYLMRGLGFNVVDIIGSFGLNNRWMIKELLGGEVQIGAKSGSVHALLSAGYRRAAEEVVKTHLHTADQAAVIPEHGGMVSESEWYMNLNALFGSNDNINAVKVDLNNRDLKGIEALEIMVQGEDLIGGYVVEYESIRSTYDRVNIYASYDYFKGNSDNDYLWRAGAFINYGSNKDAYIEPVGIQNFNAMDVGIHFKYNLPLNPLCQLLVGVNVTSHTNLSKDFAYEGPDPDAAVISEFVVPDFDFRTMDYYKIGGSLMHATKMKKMGYFIGADAAYFQGGSLSRTVVSVKFGLYF